MNNMIEIQNLTKRYGDRVAVDDISFAISKGEIVGFLGPNGAGKSTTMNMLTGYISSTAGVAKIDGYDIQAEPKQAKKKIGYLPEHPPLYPDMTVIEYLNFVYELKNVTNLDKKEHIDSIMELAQISDVQLRLIKNLSKGYRQRVGLAQALVGNPDILILDEPTVGLDPMQIIEMRNVIKELGKEHTIILSSHILPEVNAVCSRVIIINYGKIIADLNIEDLDTSLEDIFIKLTSSENVFLEPALELEQSDVASEITAKQETPTEKTLTEETPDEKISAEEKNAQETPEQEKNEGGIDNESNI